MSVSEFVFFFFFNFFFFNDTATTEIYTLSLHDALPISPLLILPISHCGSALLFILPGALCGSASAFYIDQFSLRQRPRFLYCPFLVDRKSTRLNSSHTVISYAVFCLKKKKQLETCPYISYPT